MYHTTLTLAASALMMLSAASPAMADRWDNRWDNRHDRHWNSGHGYNNHRGPDWRHHRNVVVFRTPRVYYAPAPVVYYTQPAYTTVTPVRWVNPVQNINYQLTPTQADSNDGRYCREYQAIATVGSRRQETYGTACMQPDGSWEIVN